MSALRRIVSANLIYVLIAIAIIAIWAASCSTDQHAARQPIPRLRDRPDAYLGPSPEDAAARTGGDPWSIE